MPSLAKTLLRWYRTVWALMNSWAPISAQLHDFLEV
jgi:hypothetical protein